MTVGSPEYTPEADGVNSLDLLFPSLIPVCALVSRPPTERCSTSDITAAAQEPPVSITAPHGNYGANVENGHWAADRVLPTRFLPDAGTSGYLERHSASADRATRRRALPPSESS